MSHCPVVVVGTSSSSLSGCSEGSPGESEDGPTETRVAADEEEGEGALLSLDGGGTDR